MRTFYGVVAAVSFSVVAIAGASVWIYSRNHSSYELTSAGFAGFAFFIWLGFASLRARRSRLQRVVRRTRLADGACPGSGGYTTEIPAEMIYVTYSWGGQWQERTPARTERHSCEVCGYTHGRA